MTARRTALLGFGNVAEKGHLQAWRRRSDFQIVAVADTSSERRSIAAGLLPDVRLYADCDDLLANERLDVVDIATPPTSHAPLAIRSAEAGCHVLCEKPLTTSLDDLRLVTRTVAKTGVVLNTVHNWKSSAQFHRVAALLAEGAIGRLSAVRFDTVRNGPAAAAEESWRADSTIAGGGILLDHGWHLLYLLREFCGRSPLSIRAAADRRRYVDSDVEDTVSCFLDFGTVSGEIHLTWAGIERRTTWQFRGTEGSLTLDEHSLVLDRGGELYRFGFPQSLSDGSNHPDWFGAVIDHFVQEIEDPYVRGRNLAEAEQCLILTTLAYESAAGGGRVLGVPSFVDPEPATACS